MSNCVEWWGSKDKDGYGLFNFEGKLGRAHRLAWDQTNGPIPAGMCVLHKCDNPSCVNVDHLFLGTHKDNTRDMYEKGRSGMIGNTWNRGHTRNRGEKHGNAKLKEQNIQEICDLRKHGFTQQKIADWYGVDRGTIKDIVNGRCWKHLSIVQAQQVRAPQGR